MDIRGYIRQARTLPFGVTMRKAAGLLRRSGARYAQLVADTAGGSYSVDMPSLNSKARITVSAADVPADLQATLQKLGDAYLGHRFDLLGSGWVSPVYGFAAAGFLGHRYQPRGPLAPAVDGAGLSNIVNRSNLTRASEIWRQISKPGYTPIDWQLDFRSGYRWSALRPSLRLSIPVDTGADVKVPWELGRLQHLPQLALCAILAAGGAESFQSAGVYVREISDQLADFLATNPPRFGVNWMCPMDIGIRAANIALTLSLLAGAGMMLPGRMQSIAANALSDHAAHVADNLEYSEVGRSNHYLGDLGGMLWASWMLTGEQAERQLVFAIAEIQQEADHQFLPDGGNYEGSTNYHRLSGEIVLFSLALVASLDKATIATLEQAKPPRRAWRAGFPSLPLQRYGSAGASGVDLVSPAVLRKLQGAGLLARAVQGSDGTVVQIGDTDSGRFFKLHPTPLPKAVNDQDGPQDGAFIENTLDHAGFASAVQALFGNESGRAMDAIVVRHLAGANAMVAPLPAPLAEFGDLEALLRRWHALPAASRRLRRIPLGSAVEPAAWSRDAFADFGLYLFRHGDQLVAFRCAGLPPRAAPRGHRHDDNLAIEYRLGAQECRDPGSFVYTPSVARRNAYRSDTAHDAPRACGISIGTTGTSLFDFEEAGHAECLCWQRNAVAGALTGTGCTILRIVELTTHELVLYDGVEASEIADVPVPLAVSHGYGRL